MCGCNKGSGSGSSTSAEFEVRLPDGSTKTVVGEAAAKIEVTANGGGSYTRK